MGDYVKKALLNLKDFEQKVISNYQEKYQINKKVEEVEQKYSSLSYHEWANNHFVAENLGDLLFPNEIKTKSSAKVAVDNANNVINKAFDTTGKRITVKSVKTEFFKNAPQDIKHLMNNNQYDNEISKFANDVNMIKSNLRNKINPLFKKATDIISSGTIFGLVFSLIGLIVCLALTAHFKNADYKYINPNMTPFNLIFIGLTCLFGFKLVKNRDVNKNIAETKPIINKAAKDYNFRLAEIYLDAFSPLVQSHIELEVNKVKEEIAPLLEENEAQLKKYTEEYHSKETLSNEIIDLYGSLDDPEKELFIRLGIIVDEEKDLMNVYMKCMESKNQRLILAEERARTAEAVRQTELAEKQAAELKHQSEIARQQMRNQEEHYRNLARQNDQLNKQQAEHNKKMLQNSKKQLDTAKKQLEAAKKIEYETEYQNSKLKDIL